MTSSRTTAETFSTLVDHMSSRAFVFKEFVDGLNDIFELMCQRIFKVEYVATNQDTN